MAGHRAAIVRRLADAPVPSASELVRAPRWWWFAMPALGGGLGALVALGLGHLYLWIGVGASFGLAGAWLIQRALGAYRQARIRAALEGTKLAGAVGFVEWHRRRGSPDVPYLMIADSRGGPVRWCIPLMQRSQQPTGVELVRLYGGLRRGRWAVPFHTDRAMWPVGPVRRRPLWTAEKVLGPLPSLAPDVPRPVRRPDLPADTRWQPVRLSLKRTAGRVAVVAYELYTGRVLDSGFLPRGIDQGRSPEQNGLYAQMPDRRSMLYGPGWSAVAVLGENGAQAVPVRRLGLAR